MPTERMSLLYVWLANHAGMVSVRHLVTMGFSERAVYRMVERGELVVVHPGVYRSAQWPMGEVQRMLAACFRNRAATVGFLTAARQWQFRNLPHDHLLHVLVPHGSSPDLAGCVVHRCRRIDVVDVVERDDGIRLTSPARTLFDIAGAVGDTVTTSILEQLINDGRGTFTTHAATLARLGHPQRPGTVVLSRVLAARPAWSAALQSDLEARVSAEIVRQGLPVPDIQFTLELGAGWRIRFDFAWPHHRVALEVDHPFWHAGEQPSHRDKRRDRRAGALGWRTIRLTSFDVDHGLTAAIADVGETLRRIEAA